MFFLTLSLYNIDKKKLIFLTFLSVWLSVELYALLIILKTLQLGNAMGAFGDCLCSLIKTLQLGNAMGAFGDCLCSLIKG